MKELEKNDLQEIEGGIIPWLVAVAIGVTIGAINEIFKDWDNFERGIQGEPYQPK
jgi:lactobin A/cerein 7B family class IIb bacteriocin